MKVLLCGGGTLGSVSPLLSLYEEAKKQSKQWTWFWVGTKSGIERKAIAQHDISFEWIPAAKLRRYPSVRTLGEPFVLAISFIRALFILFTIKPDVVVGAGSFVSVPVMWAAWCMRVRIVIHQQDVRATLSNTLTAWCASVITTTFEKSVADFPKGKARWIGNPLHRAHGVSAVHVPPTPDPSKKLILILGGSSGAVALNNWVQNSLEELCTLGEVVHITGMSHAIPAEPRLDYYAYPLLDHAALLRVMQSAHAVVTRAGISTITELAYYKKAAVFVPMPKTHQEDNAFFIAQQRAGYALRQDQLAEKGVQTISKILYNPDVSASLGNALHALIKQDAAKSLVRIIGNASAQ